MDGSVHEGFRSRPGWLVALLLVLVGQAGLALHLFGSTARFADLTDPRPIMSGRHPLHLYHGWLGASTFRDRYTTSCYDPSFQAGYPKTPIFDGGCRPAEAFLTLAGGHYDARPYKQGLFAICCLVPLAFAVAGRSAGLSAMGACLAAVGGCLVWWSPPVRAILDAGHVDLLLAGLMGLIFLGGLVRYTVEPGPIGWLLLSGSAVVGWYAHPVVWLGLVPIVALYYVATAPRHGVAWHLGLMGVTAAGLAPNLWWLWDWGRFWWLRQPSVDDLGPLPCWGVFAGTLTDYVDMLGPGFLGWGLLIIGTAGLVAMVRNGHRGGAGLFVLAGILAIAVARLGLTWPTLAIVGADRAATMAVAALVFPAAFLISQAWAHAPFGRVAASLVCLIPAMLAWGGPIASPLEVMTLQLEPLPLGLSTDQQQLVTFLRDKTTGDARILIEESDPERPGWNWTALLPALTGRSYLGGLDPDACIEHSFVRFQGGRLNGRAYGEWTPTERKEFCRRYNIGWVVCRSPAAIDWWATEPSARVAGRFRDQGDIVVFALDRPLSFVIAGRAKLERADTSRLVLTDIVPNEAGEVIVSYHSLPGLRAAPAIVVPEIDKDLHDPIPMIKLKVPGPMSRITITW